LEKKLELVNSQALNSDLVKKFKFDNQIQMRRLEEYKKAEKGAKDLVNDYESMKMKYFNVLTPATRKLK